MGREPNHICMNMACHRGENGGRKRYYACDACDRKSFRVVACCPECYAAVMKALKPNEKIRPSRTDKTEAEIDEIMTKPIEEIEAKTREELSDYEKELDTIGLDGVIEIINHKIDSGTEQ